MSSPAPFRQRHSPVLISIVNYRTSALVIDCLASLAGEIAAYPQAHAVIVDNASGDGSAERIAAAIEENGWQKWTSLVASSSNGGFSYGNNLAVASAPAGFVPCFVWLLNPDTRVRPGALLALLDFMHAHPCAGVAGTLLEDGDGVVWPYAFRFPTVAGEVERAAKLRLVSRLLQNRAIPRKMDARPAQVDWVSGASMMIRAGIFDAIGPMDEGYFLYFEETDFCLRARRAGWQCWYVPDARVLHIAGQSTGITGKNAVVPRMPAYWFESRRRYFLKNHGHGYAICADMAWMIAHLFWRIRRRLQALPDTDPANLLSDFFAHSALRQPLLNRAANDKDGSATARPEMRTT
ncbi:glycosyltransferase family 2 protein [Sphingobium bisphenolivorans]|uniref:glycosyltransferase family 2 protein n=1 Tax=Sphingobium bisphenolivorans TaxID=1335760 RepID=UPI00039C1D74|nr:glycosyltransferase family 2 protein [Sphingobium bisphenolivorans]